MPDINNVSNTQTNSTVPNNQPASGGSPWDEPLPEEPAPKPKIVGGFIDQAEKKPESVKPFNLPSDIESKTFPPVVQASQMAGVDTIAKNPAPVSQVSTPNPEPKTNPAFNYSFSETQSQPTTSPAPTQPIAPPLAQASSAVAQVHNTVDSLSVAPKLTTQPVVPAVAPSQPVSNVTSQIPNNPPANNLQGSTLSSAIIQPSVPAPSVEAPAVNTSPVTQPNLGTDPAPATNPVVPESGNQSIDSSVKDSQSNNDRHGLSQLFANLKHEKAPEVSESTEIAEVPLSTKKIKRFPFVLVIIIGLITILAGLIWATESGYLSLGLEKYYGTVGLEKIWNGLSKNSETALGQSFLVMNDHKEIKATGTMSLKIDKTIKSNVTTPLVSQMPDLIRLGDSPIKAVLTAIGSDGGDTFNDGLLNNSSSATTSSNVDQATTTAYVDTSTTRSIDTSFTASVGVSGNEATITVKKPLTTNTVNLKNKNDVLWVKSDKIKFDPKAESGKWLSYTLPKLKNTNIFDQVFSIDATKGFSANGSRIGNEKIGDVRCYKYLINNVEIGDSLLGLGVPSDSVQSISGTAWIGIKDKLVRKIDLKVTNSTSSPVIQMILSVSLTDFDVANNFVTPSNSDVIDLSADQ